MAFDVPKIEKYDFYIDVAFKRATKVDKKTIKGKNLTKLDVVKDSLVGSLERILHKFPELDQLDPFYKELFKATIDYGQVKKSLGGILWAIQKVKFFHRQYYFSISKLRDDHLGKANEFRRGFYGRINSVLKQIRKELMLLEEARKVLKSFPVVKTGMKTICISGFPNVGKTTLMFKLTGSKPDIQPYAFTTKGINVAYLDKLQLLDTPGTLNREDKMNIIELSAHLAMKYLADKIIYIFDPTETYDLVDQIKLYQKIKKLNKPVLIYESKRDITDVKHKELEKFKILTFKELEKKLE